MLQSPPRIIDLKWESKSCITQVISAQHQQGLTATTVLNTATSVLRAPTLVPLTPRPELSLLLLRSLVADEPAVVDAARSICDASRELRVDMRELVYSFARGKLKSR